MEQNTYSDWLKSKLAEEDARHAHVMKLIEEDKIGELLVYEKQSHN